MATATLTPQPQLAAAPARAESAGSGFYHPELDGLRFFAFLAVFCFHAFPLRLPEKMVSNPVVAEIMAWMVAILQAGQLGVDLFFVLSAYLITELLVREWQAKGEIDIGAFYVRRALRIWPLYYAFLLFIYFCEPLFYECSLPLHFFIPMALFAGNWANVALAARPATSATLLWSVSVEEQFYLVWPWVVRWLTPARLAWACAAMIGIAAVTRAVLVAQGAHDYVLYYNTFVRLDSLAAGALLALWLNGKAPDLTAEQRLLLAAGALAAMVIGMRFLRVGDAPAWGELVSYPLWSLASTLILLATLQPQGEATGLLTWSPIVYLGRISYGLYVLHFLMMSLALACGLCRPGSVLHGLYGLIGTIAVAALSYQFLEKPFLGQKERFAVIASGK